jgi:prepilin-type N-terminal cleavage/methylation domain-containing protein
MRGDKGFTMIEMLIAVVMVAIVAGGLVYILSGSRRASRIAELDSQTQQNARVAVDFITRDLRCVGFGLDIGRGQRPIAHAGPYDLVFNANIEPEPDNASTPGYPAAMSTSSAPSTVPAGGTILYAPTTTFQTGAETVRFTLDSNNDGTIDANDKTDEAIEGTQNPFDYSLTKQAYGFDGASNGGANEAVALLRGPDAYPDGSYPYPLFAYWYDHDDDTSTPDRLWGDGSGNGELEQAEIATLTPVAVTDIPRINRVKITVTGTARAVDHRYSENQGYREIVMTSEVAVRNNPVRSAIIRGVVFNDLNGDGVQDTGEDGLSGVKLRLNTGVQRTTGASGVFIFRVDPGSYTVTETDPTGYTSTTPNSVIVTAVKGTVVQANFGDRAIAGYGVILGKVILFEDDEGTPEPTEFGVQDVEIFLNSGERDTTDDQGQYMLLVPVNTYSVTMVVPPGYGAVGPVTVDRTLDAEGDTAIVNFGLLPAAETGTIQGKVYLDEDEDGVLDIGESGIASVTISLSSGDTTLTDATGDYSFTVIPGTYDVTEHDLGGYVSTTINNVTGVVVVADTTITIDFGDILASELSFTVITLGETQRALCITSADLNEDNRGDQEIILGTKYVSGISNLNVWENEWKNSSTPNTAIFDQTPWYSRTPSEDILSVDNGDIDGDGTNDIITGLTSASGKVLVWLTQTSGGDKGQLPDIPNTFFISTGIADVLSAVLYSIDADADVDALIGTEYMPNSGRLEVWFNDGSANFSHDASDVYEMAGDHLAAVVRSLAIGKIAGSPATDVVLGTATGVNTGKIEIFRDNGSPNGKFTYMATIEATGEVNAVVIRDMLEDSDGDADIIVGTTSGVGTGWIEVWHNNGNGTFGELNNLGEYVPSDTAQLNGEVLCLGVENFDRDIYPDIVVGVKKAGTYSGEVKVFQCYGYIPSAGSEWASPDIGEVITLTINDFNKDWNYDFAVGTRTSLSQGHVVVFFND